MNTPQPQRVELKFDGTVKNRMMFLARVDTSVNGLSNEGMKLGPLLTEIVGNIYDHAYGKGSLVIEQKEDGFHFEIRDDGQQAHDFAACVGHSTLPVNGTEHGRGLRTIRRIAQTLGIDLQIDTSHGFRYSGVYTPGKRS